jgi:CxxC-x17-CxxC domain-containing protein
VHYVDKTLTCRDCGEPFTFTEGEQTFFAQKGLMNEPGRCPACRTARKVSRGGLSYASAGGYSSDGYDSGYRPGPHEMFDAVCAACGGIAQVPFQPSGMKPVYCSCCFEQRRSYR